MQAACDALAARILSRCADDGLMIAAAESLTGGLLADAFVRIPGASAVFLGSAVTYDIRAKRSILGVDGTLLAREGAVHPDVARAMASGTARLYTQDGEEGAVIGLSTTGVAGPGPDGDKPAGLVYVGIAMPMQRSVNGGRLAGDGRADDTAGETEALELHLHGTREEVRRLTVLRVLEALAERLGA
ncbi:CinA family protein [Bifidobacterium samirii]|nr:CinA family protein [Bifidobacterium samirii]